MKIKSCFKMLKDEINPLYIVLVTKNIEIGDYNMSLMLAGNIYQPSYPSFKKFNYHGPRTMKCKKCLPPPQKKSC